MEEKIRIMKRIITLLLVFTLVTMSLPLGVIAEELTQEEQQAYEQLAETLSRAREMEASLPNNDPTGSEISVADQVASQSERITYLETLTPINSDRYTGNEGDSFIDTIGRRNGNIDVEGNQYTHGLTAWLARWNYSSEVSWVWNEYDLNSQFEYLRGKIVLIKSRNESNFDTNIEIIGDGVVLYTSNLTPDTLPTTELNIDVSRITKLTIKLHDNMSVSGGTAFGLADFRLIGDGTGNNGDNQSIYADSEVYLADAIINGSRDKDGKNKSLGNDDRQ